MCALNKKSPKLFEHYWEGQECSKSWEICFADMQAAFVIHAGIPAVEMRICLHGLNTCGNITFHMGHTHWRCNWLSGGACFARDGKDTTCIPRIVGHYTKSVFETPGTCTDRRSSNTLKQRPAFRSPISRTTKTQHLPRAKQTRAICTILPAHKRSVETSQQHCFTGSKTYVYVGPHVCVCMRL